MSGSVLLHRSATKSQVVEKARVKKIDRSETEDYSLHGFREIASVGVSSGRRQGNLEGHLGIARFLGGRNREEPAGDRYNNSGTDRSLGEIPKDRVSARKGDQHGKVRGRSGDALARSIWRAKKSQVRSAGCGLVRKDRLVELRGAPGHRTGGRKAPGRENAKETSDAWVGPQGSAWDRRRTLRTPSGRPQGWWRGPSRRRSGGGCRCRKAAA